MNDLLNEVAEINDGIRQIKTEIKKLNAKLRFLEAQKDILLEEIEEQETVEYEEYEDKLAYLSIFEKIISNGSIKAW